MRRPGGSHVPEKNAGVRRRPARRLRSQERRPGLHRDLRREEEGEEVIAARHARHQVHQLWRLHREDVSQSGAEVRR